MVKNFRQKIKHEFTKTFIRGDEIPFDNGFIPGRFHEQSRAEKCLAWVKANAVLITTLSAVLAVMIGFVSLLVSLFK